MKSLKKLIAWMLIVCVVIGLIPATAYANEENIVNNPVGYVTLSVEKFVLGQGYITEPTNVPYYEGESVGKVLARVLGTGNYNNGEQSDSISNLGSVKDAGPTVTMENYESYIPQYLRTNDSFGQYISEEGLLGRNDEEWLNTYDYTPYSGWMYTVNQTMPMVGMNDYICNMGDVIRVQYTLYGYGADIGFGMMGNSYVTPANTDNLLRKVAAINSSAQKYDMLAVEDIKQAYDISIAALTDLTTDQASIDACLETLEELLLMHSFAITIAYDSNGATGIIDNQSGLPGEIVRLSDGSSLQPAIEGQRLSGFNTSNDGLGNEYRLDQFIRLGDENITLYAIWSTPLSIVYDPNVLNHGGSSMGWPDTSIYFTGDQATVKGILRNSPEDYYYFSGWNTKADGTGQDYNEGDTITFGQESITLYAIWKTGFKVIYDSNGAEGSVVDTTGYKEGELASIKSSSGLKPLDTRLFYEWNTKKDGTGIGYAPYEKLPMGKADITLYAIWKQKYEKLTPVLSHISNIYINSTDGWSIMDMVAYGKGEEISQTALKSYLKSAIELANRKSPSMTDYAKTAIILSSIGMEPTKILSSNGATINIIQKMSTRDDLGGINGAAYALMAFENTDYDMSKDKWNKQTVIAYLKDNQHQDGGWALSSDKTKVSDPDVTSMVLSALSPYYLQNSDPYSVKDMVEQGVMCLSGLQSSVGKYASYGTTNANSSAMVIVALSSLGIDADTDERFVKGSSTKYSALDGLLSFQVREEGFGYNNNKTLNAMATEQGFRALVAYTKWKEKQEPFHVYNFKNASSIIKNQEQKIEIQVHGINTNHLAKSETLTYQTQNLSVLDVLKNYFTEKELILEDSSYGGQYIKSICGDREGTFGKDYDGWQYRVNDSMPSVSVDNYFLQDGDKIDVYYGGMSIAFPNVPQITYGDKEVVLTFTTTMTSYGPAPDYSPTQNIVPINGATITWGYRNQKTTFVTDEKGEIHIPGSKADIGIHSLQIEKYDMETGKEGKYLPLVVPFASDFTVQLVNSVESDIDGNRVVVDSNDAHKDIILEKSEHAYIEGKIEQSGEKKEVTLPSLKVIKKIDDTTAIQLEIAANTVVSGPQRWNGYLELPTIDLNPTISNIEVAFMVKVGANVDLEFSEPVRLFIPKVAGKQLGYIGEDGKLIQIKEKMSSDSKEGLPAKASEGYYVLGDDVAIWTRHFTTFIAYKEGTVIPPIEPSTPPTNPSEGTKISVSVSVVGDAKLGTILSNTTVEVEKNSTAWTAIKTALDAAGISYQNTSGNYISGIAGLYEFDNGPNSGWLYTVNGSQTNLGVGEYQLSKNDRIVVRYTNDYTQDAPDIGGGDNPTTGGDGNQIIDDKDDSVTGIETSIPTDINRALKTISNKKQLSEWEMLALLRNKKTVKAELFDSLQKDLIKQKGKLRLPTDYAKLVILLRAANKSPRNFGGYDLYDKIYNNKELGKQGANGYIFSLIALTGEKNIPTNAVWNTKKIVSKILNYQKSDGGFSLSTKGNSEVDMTAMAITALAPYRSDKKVENAIKQATAYLVAVEKEDATYSYADVVSSESISQVIIALSTLNIDPCGLEFSKKENNLVTSLLKFQLEDGSFSHVLGGGSNAIATEQALLALTSYQAYVNKVEGIYKFKSTNSKQYDWVKGSNGKTYLYKNGKRLTGWQKVKSKWYYMYKTGERKGQKAVNTTIGGYKLNVKGERKNK